MWSSVENQFQLQLSEQFHLQKQNDQNQVISCKKKKQINGIMFEQSAGCLKTVKLVTKRLSYDSKRTTVTIMTGQWQQQQEQQ